MKSSRCPHKARYLKCKCCEMDCCAGCIGLEEHKCQMVGIKKAIERDLLGKHLVKIETPKIIKI